MMPRGEVRKMRVVREDLDDRQLEAESLLDALDLGYLVPEKSVATTPLSPARAVRPERCT